LIYKTAVLYDRGKEGIKFKDLPGLTVLQKCNVSVSTDNKTFENLSQFMLERPR
jgi:hypothetical protein